MLRSNPLTPVEAESTMTPRSRAATPSICIHLALRLSRPPGVDSAGETLPATQLRRRGGGSRMDDVVNRMARELSDAIAAAVAEDARVEACRERARAAGFELKVALEAVIGFVNRSTPGALAKVPAPQKGAARTSAERRPFEISANDRRFLRSLRIAADETQ